MNNGQPQPSPFERAALIGQPFTVVKYSIPVNAELVCNCVAPADRATLTIINGAPATCPNCQKTWVVGFNPANGQLMVGQMQADTKADS